MIFNTVFYTKKSMFIIVRLLFIFGASHSLASPVNLPTNTINSELDDIVYTVCNKKMVLLGEDSSHGAGKTLEVKSLIVKRLIDECGFSAVFFESPVYEFLHLEQSLSSQSSTPQQLAQAIGGLWSSAKPIHSLLSELYEKAVIGKIRLFGIDAQLGSANQPFTQEQLPNQLAKYLPEVRAIECESILFQYLNWQYDEKSPYNNRAKNRISSCVSEIKRQIPTKKSAGNSITVDAFMIDNFASFLEFQSGDYFNLRDKAMADNIAWHSARLPPEAKIIVWSATVHVAKSLSPFSATKIPMGFYIHEALGEQVVSIGFSALSGSFGRSESKTKTIKPATLETKALLDQSENVIFLDKNALISLGNVSAHPIHYNKLKSANWSEILDGIVVLRQELPLEFIK